MKNKYQPSGKQRGLALGLSIPTLLGKAGLRPLLLCGVLGMTAAAPALAAPHYSVMTELPQLVCPGNIAAVNDAGSCGAVVAYPVPQGTHSSLPVTTTLVSGLPSGATFPLGSTVVTYRAADTAGNSVTGSFTVTVRDGEAPSITAPAPIVVNADPGRCSASGVNLGNASAADNCGSVSVRNNSPVTVDKQSGAGSYPVGITTITWTATDVAGNTRTAVQLVTVLDNQLPTIMAPADVAVSTDPGQATASNVQLGRPTAGDNCSGVSVSSNAPATYPLGTTTVEWTATDAAGNTVLASQLVTVNAGSSQPPMITAPANVTVSADSGQCSASAVALGTPVLANNNPGITVGNDAPASYPAGTTTVTWTATAAAGQVATATQTVTVVDTERPRLMLPRNLLFSSSIHCNQTVVFRPTAIDNCSPVTVVARPASGTIFPMGTTTVSVTATDAAGNSQTGSFQVTVKDQTPPTVLTRNVTVALINGVATVRAAQVDNGSFDYCNIASMSLSRTSFTCLQLGRNTVTLTVTDLAGNVATAPAVVTVTGIVPPPTITVTRTSGTYTGGSNNTIFLGYGAQSATLTASGGTSYRWSPTLNLSNPNIANPVFSPRAEGRYTYTVTATNQFGCTSTASVTLQVMDASCGNGRNAKVLVCHNGHEICISANAVPAHLERGNHDDQLGPCTPSQNCSRDMTAAATMGAVAAETAQPAPAAGPAALPVVLEAFPNPFAASTTVHFRATETAPAQVRIYDQLGKLMATLYDGVAEGGQDYSLLVSAEKLPAGLYRCQFTSQGKVQTQRLAVVK